MKNRAYLLAWTMIVLSLPASMTAADCDVGPPGRAIYTPYTFTTLAGNAGYGSADGTGNAARFAGPFGVAVDSAGNVYVADSGNNTIRKGYAEPVTAVTLFVTSGPSFDFILTGPAGQSVMVEASTDLVSWLPVWTNTFTGALHFSDPQSGVKSYY